ncbi:NXPE family member 3-like [Amphiura filiformis]|uniref:NXPE family member 3-like n=1 Tax=Amphiura filiformis TaxID=82378 RepID=UPI003B2262B7
MPKRRVKYHKWQPSARPPAVMSCNWKYTRHLLFGCLLLYIFLSVNDVVYHPGHAVHFLIFDSGLFRDRSPLNILPNGVLSNYHFVCPPKKEKRTPMNQQHIPMFIQQPNLMESTSVTNSTYSIVNPKSSYNLCDEIEVLIQAKDWRNSRKVYGGDYFRARIYTARYKASAASDGDIVDNGDGTYSAFFTLRWPGEVKVGVNLIHPSEGIFVLNKLREEMPTRFAYTGRFISQDDNHMENVDCHVSMEKYKGPVCDFSHKATGATWYCVKPKDTNLSCDDWLWHVGNTTKSHEQALTLLTNSEAMLFYIQKAPIRRLQTFAVNVSWPSPTELRALSTRQLPPCKPGTPMTSPYASGFFWHDVWFSNHCSIHKFSISEARECLQHKTLHFLGDSTVRQFMQFFLSRLGRTLKKLPLEPFVNWKVGPFGAYDETNNITMLYRHHGFPIRNSWTVSSHVDYMVNVINTIHGGPDTVVVLTAWAHFTATNLTYYANRMQSVLQAVKELHQRSPDTLVVVRSANTREHDGTYGAVYTSDWYARALDDTMKDIFSQYPKVGFLDMWDMTSSHYSNDVVHPPEVIVANAINQLLTYICPSQPELDR